MIKVDKYNDYRIIAGCRKEKVVCYSEYGELPGQFVLVTEKDGVLRIYKDYFGSCADCDTLQGLWYDMQYNKNTTTEEMLDIFIEKYVPFLEKEISKLNAQDIIDGIKINNKGVHEFTEKEQEKLINKIIKKYNITK